jgi:hypothetical protein
MPGLSARVPRLQVHFFRLFFCCLALYTCILNYQGLHVPVIPASPPEALGMAIHPMERCTRKNAALLSVRQGGSQEADGRGEAYTPPVLLVVVRQLVWPWTLSLFRLVVPAACS